MGSGMSDFWGWDVSTLGADVATLGFGTATAGKCTLRDCVVFVGLCTLGGGGVRGMQVFGVSGMQALRRFLRSLIFGLGCSGTVVNWEGSAHIWKSSRTSVIALNCASQVIVSASLRG